MAVEADVHSADTLLEMRFLTSSRNPKLLDSREKCSHKGTIFSVIFIC